MLSCKWPCVRTWLVVCLILVYHLSYATADGEGEEEIAQAPSFGIPIHAWYPIELTAAGGRRLLSRTQTYCSRPAATTPVARSEAEPGTDLLLTCPSGTVAISYRRLTQWNTLMAVGLYKTQDIFPPSGASPNGSVAVSTTLRCASYPCGTDVFPDLAAGADANHSNIDTGQGGAGETVALANLTGGLSPSTPCCASYTNQTFLIRTAPANVILQTENLPLLALINASRTLMRAAWCPSVEPTETNTTRTRLSRHSATHASLSTTSESGVGTEASDCTASLGLCIIRLLDPRFFYAQTVNQRLDGDGGLTFPVSVELCGSPIGSMFNLNTFELITSGLHAVVTTAEHADELTLPTELIRGVLSWVASETAIGGTPGGSLDSQQLCAWGTDPSKASAYRTGDYVECLLDAHVVGTLPPLILSVPREQLLSSGLSEFQPLISKCRFALDLNQLVNHTTGLMRLYSSGSFADAVRFTTKNAHYKEPLVVIGALFLRGATLGVSRAAVSGIPAEPATPTLIPAAIDAAWRGLPLLYVAAYTPGSQSDVAPSTCAASQQPTCILEDRYYASVNRCVAVRCIDIVGYHFDSRTLTCGPSIVFISLLSFFFVVTVVTEIVFLVIHKRTERAKYAHLDLIEEAQRKKKS